MRISHQITLIACTLFTVLCYGCSANCNKATNTGKSFLTNLFTCNFEACDAMCTNNGRKDVRWFASNLTEEDLANISRDIEIATDDCNISDTLASITYTAQNVVICDSLETKWYCGERSMKIILKNINGTWKVDKLEW